MAVSFATLGECGTRRESNSTHFIKPWAAGEGRKKKKCAQVVRLHYFIQGHPPNQHLLCFAVFFFFFSKSIFNDAEKVFVQPLLSMLFARTDTHQRVSFINRCCGIYTGSFGAALNAPLELRLFTPQAAAGLCFGFGSLLP